MANEIQQAFMDGVDEIFTTMFTTEVSMYLLDKTSTTTNIYEEVPRDAKVYKDPFNVAAKVVLSTIKAEEPDRTEIVTAKVSVPTKQLVNHNVPRTTPEDFDALRSAKFVYKGVSYLVDEVNPRVFVADEFYVYEFLCRMDTRKSVA